MADTNEIRDDYEFRATLVDNVTDPARQMAAGMENVADSADSATVALDAINQANQAVAAGLDRVASAGQTGTRSFQNMQRALDPMAASIDRLNARLEQLQRLGPDRVGGQEQYNQLLAAGTARLEDAQRRQEAFNNSVKDTNTVTGQAAFAMRQAQVQFTQFFTSIATGAPLLTAFIQQGHQLYDVSVVTGTGFSSLGLALKSMFASIGGFPVAAVAAIVAGLTAITVWSENVAEAQGKLRTQLAGSTADYVKAAEIIDQASRHLAASIGATADEVQQAGRELYSAGFQGTQQQFNDLTKQAAALAEMMGTKLPDAMKLYTLALRDPIAAAQQLGKNTETLHLVSASTLELATQTAEAGDRAKATTIIFNDLNKALSVQRENLTPLQQQWKDIDAQFNSLTESVRKFALSVGDFLREQVVETAKEFKILVDLIKQIPTLLPSSGVTGGPQIVTSPGQNYVGSIGAVPPQNATMMNQATAGLGTFGQATFQALMAAESGGQQYGSGGGLLIPGGQLPTGVMPGANQPVGIGQIMPSTAGGYGFSTEQIATPQGNIQASAAHFSHLFQKYNGDPTLVVAAYNWGEGNLDKFLQQGGQMPAETQGEIGRVLGMLYRSGVSAPAGGYGGTGGAAGAAVTSAIGAQQGTEQFGPQTLDNILGAQASAGRFGSTTKDMAALNDQIEKQQALVKVLTQDYGANAAVTDVAQKRLQNLQEALRNLEDPERQRARDAQQSAQVTQLLGEADQKLLATKQRMDNYDQAHADKPLTEAQRTEALAGVQAELTAEYEKKIEVIQRDTQQTQDQVAAYSQNAAAVADTEIAQKAYNETLKSFSETSAEFPARLAQMTDALHQQKVAQDELKLAPMTQALRDQEAVLNLEINTLGQNSDARSVAIDLLRTELQLRAQIKGISQEAIDGYLAEKRAVDELNITMQNRQRDMNELAGAFTSAFDTIGNAMAQAFVQGQGAAVNWGNVMKAVVQQVIQEFLKLAILNPLLNGLFGQNNATLFSVASTVGGVGGGGGLLGSFLPAAGLGYQVAGGGGGIFGSGGLGGLFSGTGFFGASGTVANALAYTPFGSVSGEATNAALAGMGGQFGPETLGAYTAAGGAVPASIGSLLGGAGLGFGVGSLAGSQIQRALGKTGPGPLAGAGAGAAAGAVIGSIVPGIGTLIGGLIGGLLGGGGGGLIGPKAPSPYAATYVGLGQGGLLETYPGLTGQQITPSNYQAIANEVSAFNQNLGNLGVQVLGTRTPPPAGAAGGLGFFGTAKNAAGLAGQSVTDVFSNLRFGAQAQGYGADEMDVLNRALDRTFASFQELGAEVNKVRTFMELTVPTLRKYNDQQGSLNAALTQINAVFDPAIKTAQELGYAEQDLTAARDEAIQKAHEAADAQFTQFSQTLGARYAAAQAAISGDPGQAINAQLLAFDVQADAQRKQLNDQLVSTYGDTIKSTQTYADLMAGLERTLGAERLAVQTQSNNALIQQQKQAMEQARSQAAQIISSITDYTRGLQYSQASPLSPRDQLAAAQREFNAVSGAALAGNADSLSKLTSYSDTLLAAARNVYGSGEGYAQVFQQVTDTLAKVSQISPDTLTASVFAAETRSQTDTLVAAIADLQNEVAGLRAQLTTGSAMPSRLAA